MTLWIAWSALTSALIAIAATAVGHIGAHFHAPRRFVWMGAMVVSVTMPLLLCLRSSLPASTAPGVANTQLSMRGARDSLSASIGDAKVDIDYSIGMRDAITNALGYAHVADSWIMRAWALMSLALLLAFVHASVTLRRRRSGWRSTVTESGRVLVARDAGPAVLGFIHPRIVIPEWALSLDGSARDLLLRHEVEHIRAGDSRALLCAELMLICFPWNAALWWMARQHRLAIEIDCDARVIRAVGGAHTYGMVLLAVSERYATLPMSAGLSEPGANLEARINAMTAPHQRRPIVASLSPLGSALAVLLTAAWIPRPAPLARSVADVSHTVRNASATAVAGFDKTQSLEKSSAIHHQEIVHSAPRDSRGGTGRASRPERPIDVVTLQPLPTFELRPPEATAVVSRDPKPLPGNPAPRYPDALRANGTEGHVLLTFSTDARGVPDTTTISVIESTNEAFSSSVRRVLPNWRFDSGGRVRFACRFMSAETEQKELADHTSPAFTIDGVVVLPVVVVSATPANKKPLDAPQAIGIPGERHVNLEWEHAPLRSVVRVFADFSGRQILLDPGLADLEVTISIRDRDWRRALDDVLAVHGLAAAADSTGNLHVSRRNTILRIL